MNDTLFSWHHFDCDRRHWLTFAHSSRAQRLNVLNDIKPRIVRLLWRWPNIFLVFLISDHKHFALETYQRHFAFALQFVRHFTVSKNRKSDSVLSHTQFSISHTEYRNENARKWLRKYWKTKKCASHRLEVFSLSNFAFRYETAQSAHNLNMNTRSCAVGQ